MKLGAIVAALVLNTASLTAEPLNVYAAGSLKAALTDAGKAFTGRGADNAQLIFEFGASGLLRERIERGEKADIFASADMGHPQKLADQGMVSGAVQVFARNSLCAIARPGLSITPATVLNVALNSTIKLGISTPKSDPSGDYALALFDRAEAMTPGASAILRAKALELTGSADKPKAPDGLNQYAWIVGSGQADIFLTYCTNARLAVIENPALQSIALPPELKVGAQYGLVTLREASPSAQDFLTFLTGPNGQSILASHGFEVGS
jgi:molybdate transport system substrate-binding protein